MKIKVNEREVDLPEGATVGEARARLRPAADVLVRNGFPARPDDPLAEGDAVVLIRRGEQPSVEELETLLSARHTPGVHERVRSAQVGIAGLGGLGSATAVALARIGVGGLVLADFDVVEPSNLNRQQYFLDQIGRPKTEALAEVLVRINPRVGLTLHQVELSAENAPRIFRGAHAVVEALDRAAAKAMLIAAVLGGLPGVPVVAASGLAGSGAANALVTRRVARNLWVVGDGVSEAKPGVGLMAPRVGVAAHHQANAVLRLLLGEDPEG